MSGSARSIFERFVGANSGQFCHRTATLLPHNRRSLQRQVCPRARRNLPNEQPFLRIVPYMPTFRLTRISSPGLLAKISPDCLLQFLAPMREHLEERGFVWPRAANEQIDYEKLGHLLHFPKEGLPPQMVVPLVLVDEMSTDLQMDRLLGAATQRQIELSLAGSCSPSDVAVQVWLQAPRLLEELHAENYTIRQKNFCCFAGIGAAPRVFPAVSDSMLRALERDLDDGFEEYQRGRGCRVFIFDHGRKVWILTRRGATFRREECMKVGGEPGVQFFRPMMYDVLVYDTETDDLGLHVETKWQERLYLSCIGQHIFRNPEYFPAARILTFDPIIERGADALRCADIPGMHEVKLVEVNKRWNNAQHEIDIKKADDFFALGDRARSFLQYGTLTKLVFRVWFEGDNKPRSVTVRWPNVTKYERDSDSERIEAWLRLRGFIARDEQVRDAAD